MICSQKEIIVGIAKHVWSNPDRIFNGDKFYFTISLRSEHHLNIKSTSLEQLAKSICDDIGYVSFGNEFEIKNAQGRSAEMHFLDGYFGRPLVPAHVYTYEPLKRKQFKELQSHLEKLRKKDLDVLDWT